MKDPRFYIVHMLECIANVQEDTARGRDFFFQNRTYRDAVMRNLQLLAESSKRVPADLKAQLPDVEWADIADFRNVAVHDYLTIDYNEIWDIIVEDLPPLKARLQLILES